MSQETIARVSLVAFAGTGRFGPVAVGDSRSRVRARFGPPTDHAPGRPGAGIWKFGDVEFHFDADRVLLIHCDDFADVPRGGPIALDPWVFRERLTVAELLDALAAADITAATRPDPFNPGCVEVMTAAGLRFSITVVAEPHAKPKPMFSCAREPAKIACSAE